MEGLTVASNESLAQTEQEVSLVVEQRKQKSEEMRAEGKTVTEMLGSFDNDYEILERLYKQRTGGELLANPYDSPEAKLDITKSCSIVIPTYNNSERLENCLRSIEMSTFNLRYPSQLEVVIVDDGSTNEDIAEKVESMGFSRLSIRVFRQANGQVSKARYSGALQAANEVIIFTDPDVVYTPTMVEEYMKRQQLLSGTVLFGLKDEIDQGDERISAQGAQKNGLGQLPIDTSRDPRVRNDGLADCNWLKDSGHNRLLPIDVENDKFQWTASSIAWGLSLCASREALLRTFSGYDERYRGYGGDDEDLVSRLVAQGNFVIPLTGSICYHQSHPAGNQDASKHQQNIAALRDNLSSPLKAQELDDPQKTDALLRYEQKSQLIEPEEVPLTYPSELGSASCDLRIGKYASAAERLRSIRSEHQGEYWYWYDLSQAMIGSGGQENIDQAIEILEYIISEEDNAWSRSLLASAHARRGDYPQAAANFRQALRLSSSNEDAGLFLMDPEENIVSARKNLDRGKSRKALQIYDVVLAQAGESDHPWALFDSGVACQQLKEYPEALRRIKQALGLLGDNTWIYSRLGLIYEGLNNSEESKNNYNRALELDSENEEAIEGLRRLQ